MRHMSRKTVRKASKVLVREDYDTTLPTTQEARDLVREMRQEIESKEFQLNKLRELLARTDETDISAAQSELNCLQGAFSHVSQECENRLRPIQSECNRRLSSLEGKRTFCESICNSAKERKAFLESLKKATGTAMFNIEDPNVPSVSEKALYPILSSLSSLQTDVGSLKRSLILERYTQTEMTKHNDVLKRTLKSATEDEKMAIMNYNSAKQDIDVRRSAPKVQTIDDDWCDAKRSLDLNQILLKEANEALTRLNEEAKKIEVSNRTIVEDSRKLREELIILNRYMPNSDSGSGASTRAELTKEQIEIDCGKARVGTLTTKIKTEKGRLKPLLSKLDELTPKIQSEQKKLEALQNQRQKVEQDLLVVHTKRSELLSEKLFGEDQYQTMLTRIDEQSKRLAEIERRSAVAQDTIKKQMVIMKLNDEMNNLKTMDFGRFTSVLSNLLTIQDEIKSVGE